MNGGLTSNCPAFVKNTFDLVETCNRSYPSICHWSDDGMTFIIEDPDTFSSKIMPQFFSRNNFKSFVRQLNFYGFRKIKKLEVMINPAKEAMERKICRFQHDKFIRGRPELLSEMRRPRNSSSVVDPIQLATLKGEVDVLKRDLSHMSSQLGDLKLTLNRIVSNVLEREKRKSERVDKELDSDCRKKQKVKPAPKVVHNFVSFHSHLDSGYDTLCMMSANDAMAESLSQAKKKESENPTAYVNDAFDIALEKLTDFWGMDDTQMKLQPSCNNVTSHSSGGSPHKSTLKPSAPMPTLFVSNVTSVPTTKLPQKLQPLHYARVPFSERAKNKLPSKQRSIFPHAA